MTPSLLSCVRIALTAREGLPCCALSADVRAPNIGPCVASTAAAFTWISSRAHPRRHQRRRHKDHSFPEGRWPAGLRDPASTFDCPPTATNVDGRDLRFTFTRHESSLRKDLADRRLRFVLNLLQMRFAAKAFRIDLVDVFGAGGPRREPAIVGDHLDAAERLAVAGGR